MNLSGSGIVFLVPQIHVWAMAARRVTSTAARWLAAANPLAH